MPNRIRELRKAADLTMDQLAERANTSQQQIQRLETGTRRLTQEWMDRIAEALNVHPAELLPSSKIDELVPVSLQLWIKGSVQAGVWRHAVEDPEDEWTKIVVPKPDNHRSYFGLRVRGRSMDREYPEGTILICVPILEYDHGIVSGDHVIVQRRDPASDMVEATVKELVVDEEGRYWLWPKSTDPEHQAPIRLPDDPDNGLSDSAGSDEIEIVAVVVADYRVRPRRRLAYR